MVRGGGRGYTRGGGGGRGGSYRGSGGSSYRGSSGRSGFGGGYNSSRGSSSYHYDRNRDRNATRHDRHDDHKRSYRASSRDRSPDRKRSRHEDSRPSSSYSSSYRRNESSRSSRQTPPPPSVRSSTGPHRREDTSHRHSGGNDMGPPKTLPPRGSRIIRRGGGSSSHRPSGNSSMRIIRRGRESTDLRIMRKKLLLANQRDRARRIKIAKLTSSLRVKRKGEVTPRKVRKPHDKKDGDKKDEDGNEDAEEKEGEEDEEGDEKTEEGKVKKEAKEKDGEEGSDADELDEEDADEEEKVDDEEKTPREKSRRQKRTFIKLMCPHCRSKCLTFKDYSNHLYSRNHKLAMRRLALRQKTQLSQMRLNQRNAQRDIEESSKDETDDCKPQYCLLCRLNYRQPKAKHQLSEAHRNMKKFLMPYCSSCHIAFKSPMVYETHRCSLEHIKRKARNNESVNSESSDGEKEVDLKNFLTVDSVGEIDEDGEAKVEGEEGKEKINVGAEHVKKTEAFYCDLCRYYIPLKEEEESVLKKHCATRSHLKSFVRFKKDQNLRLEAERIQRRQKEAKEKKATESTENKEGENGEENEEGGEDKIWEDVDKDLGDLLREVDPDAEQEEEDEEEGSALNNERFDKFKNSENQKKELNGDTTNDETIEIKEDDSPAPTPVKAPEKVVKKAPAKKKLQQQKQEEKQEEVAVEAK